MATGSAVPPDSYAFLSLDVTTGPFGFLQKCARSHAVVARYRAQTHTRRETHTHVHTHGATRAQTGTHTHIHTGTHTHYFFFYPHAGSERDSRSFTNLANATEVSYPALLVLENRSPFLKQNRLLCGSEALPNTIHRGHPQEGFMVSSHC